MKGDIKMGKALVVSNTNFVLNKLTTVELMDSVPCTSITLSDDTVEFTGIGETKELTAIIEPYNTTDEIIWSSSDENVVTVVNGLVECVGVGTATITAVCGEESAECSISATVTLVLDDDVTVLNGHCVSNSGDRDYVTTSTNETRARSFFAIGNPLDGYKAVSKADEVYADKYPIPLPINAKTMTIITTGSDYYSVSYALLNANELCTYALSADAKGARAYPYPITISHPSNETVIDISDRNQNVNSFCVGSFTDSSKTISNAAKITVVFS